MNLDDAYRILEVASGADEGTVREARKTLAKVWHPDRHANDPALQKRAQDKLADVNAAFEVVESAGFPAKSAAKPPPKPVDPPPRDPPKPPPAAPVDKPNIEFVPARRVRWSVILVLAAALGIGAYLAITRLGASSTPAVARDATVVVADTVVVVLADATDEVREVDAPVTNVRREKTFTLGSSRDDVIAAMGQPQGTSKSTSIINGVKSASAKLTYGEASTIDLDGNDTVIGWWEADAPLHVRLAVHDARAADAAKSRGTFAVGAGRDEVLGILGPPTGIAGTQWAYGTSTLEVEYGKVIRVTQGEPKLPITPR